MVTSLPGAVSACSLAASVPVATSTAPSGGIAVAPVPAVVTVAVRSVFGAGSGNGSSTTTAALAMSGVVPPQAGVNKTVWFPFGFWLIPTTGRRWPLPFQVPANEMRPMCSMPDESTAIDDRAADGPWRYAPPLTTIPVGCPSVPLEKSPSTPTAVELPDTSRSRSATRSRAPRIVPAASTGPSL